MSVELTDGRPIRSNAAARNDRRSAITGRRRPARTRSSACDHPTTASVPSIAIGGLSSFQMIPSGIPMIVSGGVMVCPLLPKRVMLNEAPFVPAVRRSSAIASPRIGHGASDRRHRAARTAADSVPARRRSPNRSGRAASQPPRVRALSSSTPRRRMPWAASARARAGAIGGLQCDSPSRMRAPQQDMMVQRDVMAIPAGGRRWTR